MLGTTLASKSLIVLLIDLSVGCGASLVTLTGAGVGIETLGDNQLCHVGAVVQQRSCFRNARQVVQLLCAFFNISSTRCL